jgi:Arylsulfatase A and related enzymes
VSRRSIGPFFRFGARLSVVRRSRPSPTPRLTGARPATSAAEGRAERLLVLIDDAGLRNPSTFGGPIQTPNYTRLAENGLRYNRFHVTALCSPTRAALLTGRNHHRVGFGMVGEFSGPVPGLQRDHPARLRAVSRASSRRTAT